MFQVAATPRFVTGCLTVAAATTLALSGCGRDSDSPMSPVNGVRVGAVQVPEGNVGTITTIDPAGSLLTEALDINNQGAIVGEYVDATGLTHGFLRAPDGTITSIDAPGAGTAPPQGSYSWSINTDGAIAGQYTDPNGVFHGYVRAADGTFTTIDAPSAGTAAGQGTLAENINARGEVAGHLIDANGVHHGFVRATDGTIAAFDAPGGGTSIGQGTSLALASGLNRRGAATGVVLNNDSTAHGLVRDADGAVTKFKVGGAGVGAHKGTFPASLNRDGVIAGLYVNAHHVAHGFVRDADGTITKFDVNAAGADSSEGTFPQGIDGSGAITGYYGDANNVWHGFVRAVDGSITKFDAPGAGSAPGSGFGTFGLTNNNDGSVVGYYIDAGGTAHGFVRSH